MSTHTLIDADGEIVCVLTLGDPNALALNMRAGTIAVDGPPPTEDSYRSGGEWRTRPSKPAPTSTWNRATKAWADVRSLDERKAAKWEEMKATREAEIDAPLVTPYGIFDSYAEARSNISDAVLLAQTLSGIGQPVSINFTLADNSVVALDLAGMVTVGLMLGSKIQTTRGIATALREQILSAPSIATLESITWPAT